MIHPFREGNGRTQRIYIEQLCLNNGRFEIDFTDVSKEEMIAASVRSANASNDMLEKLIKSCLSDLIQIGIFICDLVGLCYTIFKGKQK